MNTRILIEITLADASILRYSTEDREFPVSVPAFAPLFYEGRLIDEGNLNISLSDIYFGSRKINNISISLDDTDGVMRSIRDANDLRGKAIIRRRIDLDTDTILESHYFLINKATLEGANEKLTLNLMVENLELFKQLYPKDKIKADDYPTALETSLGVPIPIVKGSGHEQIPCYGISEASGEYDYLIGYGIINDVSNVKQYQGDKSFDVAESEYDFYDGSQSAPHPGIAFIRFDSQQIDFENNYYEIRCDCEGIENLQSSSSGAETGALNQLKQFLEDEDYGPGLTCNASSFATAQTILDGWGVTSRAYIGEQKRLSDWIDHFLYVARLATFKKGDSGYEVYIEEYNATPDATFEEHNMVVESDHKRAHIDQITAVKLNYDYSELTKKFKEQKTRYLGDLSNNFANDQNCVAQYRLEENTFTQDSRGNNNLTNPPSNPADIDTVKYSEGLASAGYDGVTADQQLYIPDSSLDGGFPFKGGTTNRNMSICFRMNPAEAGSKYMIQKFLSSQRSFVIWYDASNKLYINFYDISNIERDTDLFDTGFTVDGAHWYHVAVTINGTTGAYRIRIHDYTGDAQLDSDKTGTLNGFVDPIQVSTADFVLGSPGTNWEGNLDEVVIFNDILSVAEIDQIRDSTYGQDITGITKEYNSLFCPDITTASKVAAFIKNKYQYQDRIIEFSTESDASSLIEGSVLSVTNNALGLSSSLYQILNITKPANDYKIVMAEYWQDIFGD